MRLFSELRRRNVLRMAVLYVVAAWLIIQVAGVLMDLAPLPGWTGQVVLAVLAIGLPIALVFSWFYELTPVGIALEKDIEPGQSITHVTGRRMDFVVISMLCAALLLFAYDKWWPEEPMEQSIAVLAFENLSDDPEQEYFSDGVSEEILNLLAQIYPLKVIARTSSFSFKDKDADVATIAERLNVSHVLEGSVRRSGDQVRITAQLIDAKDSTHVWSQIYDRDLTANNLFHIQTEIARAIARQMKTALTEENEQRLTNVPTENMDAYAAYLLGRQRLTDRKVAGLSDAAEQFARAIELDPGYAAAYAGLHDACALFEDYSGDNIHAQCPGPSEELEPLLRKALALDDTLGEAWISLGSWHAGSYEERTDEKLEAAEAAFERGIELNPSFSQGYHWYSLFLLGRRPGDNIPIFLERYLRSLEVAQRGLEIDPLSVPLHYWVSGLLVSDLEAAMWHAHRMVEIAPDSPRGYERVAEFSWSILGRVDETIKWASRAAELDPYHVWFPLLIGHAYTTLGDYDEALDYFSYALTLTTDARSGQVIEGKALALISAGREREAILLLTEFLESADRWTGGRSGMILWVLSGIDLSAGHADAALAWYRRYSPVCFDDEHPVFWCEYRRLQIARVMQELGDHEQARQWVQRLWEEFNTAYIDRTGQRLGNFGFGILDVMCLSMLGRHDEALDALEEAVHAGWRGYPREGSWRFHAEFNMTLDAIRDDPRFQAAFATIEADMAEQLEIVRRMEQNGDIATLN